MRHFPIRLKSSPSSGGATSLLSLGLGLLLYSGGLLPLLLPAASATYCPGDSPPPPPAPCPTIWGGQAECVAPMVKPSAWSATSGSWTSYPTCDATPGTGKCASEGEAWIAWQNNISGPICVPPSRTYVCTDLHAGYQLGEDIHSTEVYSMTVGTGVPGNCNVHTESAVGSHQQKSAICPASFSAVSSNDGPCHTVKYEACPWKNPIQCAGGQKMQ